MKPELITQAEFGRRIRISAPSVSKLVKKGQISVTKDGLIDYQSALKQYKDNTDPARRKVKIDAKNEPKRLRKFKLAQIDDATLSDIKKLLASEGIDTSNGLTFELIRAAEGLARAHERMFNLAVKRKEYIPFKGAAESTRNIFIGFRKMMENIPARHADIIAANLGCDAHALEQEMIRVIKTTLNEMAAPAVKDTY